MSEFKDFIKKDHFEKTEDYIAFLNWANYQLETYCFEYDYLVIKRENWIKVMSNIVNQISTKKIGELKTQTIQSLKKSIHSYLFHSIQKNDTILLSNLLIKINKNAKNSKEILLSFLKELKRLNISLSNEYFEVLKNHSLVLKTCLEKLELEEITFFELENEDLDFYFRMKPTNMKYCATKKILKQLLPFFQIKYVKNSSTEESKKLKFLVAHFNELEGIENLLKTYFKTINLREVKEVIISFDLEKIEKVFQDYRYYVGGFSLEPSMDFLFVINQKLKHPGTYQNTKTNLTVKERKEEKQDNTKPISKRGYNLQRRKNVKVNIKM